MLIRMEDMTIEDFKQTFERLISWIVEARHIGETQMFPEIPGIVYEL